MTNVLLSFEIKIIIWSISKKKKLSFGCFLLFIKCSVKKLSKMTEKLSKAMLDGVGMVTGSVMQPVVKSRAGKAFLAMAPGEVVLASLDAVSKFLFS